MICFLKIEKPIDSPIFQFLLQFSPIEKQQRILSQRIKQNADSMVVGAAIARHMLWKKFAIPLDARIAYGEFGKPYLSDYPGVHFNISHSRQYVACAVCSEPIGIDVQVIGCYRRDVAKRVCSSIELSQIETSVEQAAEFTKIWTMKEAYVKRTGLGIGNGFSQKFLPSSSFFSKRMGNTFLSISV